MIKESALHDLIGTFKEVHDVHDKNSVVECFTLNGHGENCSGNERWITQSEMTA